MTRTPSAAEAALSATVGALGDIMLEMQRRRLLLKPQSDKAKAMLNAKQLDDAALGRLAAGAFEAGATALAALGHPDCAVFSYSASDIDESSK